MAGDEDIKPGTGQLLNVTHNEMDDVTEGVRNQYINDKNAYVGLTERLQRFTEEESNPSINPDRLKTVRDEIKKMNEKMPKVDKQYKDMRVKAIKYKIDPDDPYNRG